MTHPEISDTEKFGSLWKFSESEYIGECSLSTCRHKEIYSDFEYFSDDFGHIFCSREHADLFYGIKAIE